MAKLVQMKGERCRGQVQPVTDAAGRQPLRPGLNQQPEHIEPGVLGKCRKSGYCGSFLHISMVLEIWSGVKPPIPGRASPRKGSLASSDGRRSPRQVAGYAFRILRRSWMMMTQRIIGPTNNPRQNNIIQMHGQM